MNLTVGDKIRIKATNEGAQIIKVIDEGEAVVDAFDGEIKVKASEVIPFQASDVKKDLSNQTILFSLPKHKPKTKEKELSLNERKNQFKYELDLHAESLISNWEQKTKEEILSIQLSKAKNYILEAKELRLQRVYLIHGVGSGRLRSEIHHMLHQMKEIKGYSNDYSPRFGMGATEVKLR